MIWHDGICQYIMTFCQAKQLRMLFKKVILSWTRRDERQTLVFVIALRNPCVWLQAHQNIKPSRDSELLKLWSPVIGFEVGCFCVALVPSCSGNMCVSLNLNIQRHRPYAIAGHLASWQSGIIVISDGFGKSGQQDSLAPWSMTYWSTVLHSRGPGPGTCKKNKINHMQAKYKQPRATKMWDLTIWILFFFIYVLFSFFLAFSSSFCSLIEIWVLWADWWRGCMSSRRKLPHFQTPNGSARHITSHILYMNALSTPHEASPSWRRGLFSMHQQCPRFEWLQGLKSSGGAPLHVVHIAVAPSQRRSWSKRSGTLGSKLQIKNRVLQIKYTYVYRW